MSSGDEPQTVGIRELRQHLKDVLERVKRGERVVITDRNRPVAQLTPVPQTPIERLIAEGRVIPATRRGPLPKPLEPAPGEDPYAATHALEYVRGKRDD